VDMAILLGWTCGVISSRTQLK